MNKIFIVLLFILLGSSLIVVNNIKGSTENSFNIVYENNKNLALPDIQEGIEISTGLYRIYNNNEITLDYNVNNGIYTLNGITTSMIVRLIRFQHDFQPLTNYTVKLYELDGIKSITAAPLIQFRTINASETTQSYLSIIKGFTYQTTEQTRYFELLANASGYEVTYTNWQFKLQLEKGSQSTFYTVPKLIPHYQDNLSQEEKEKIGLGAFGGITQIIKTINDIIKPVGDFINGILSWF